MLAGTGHRICNDCMKACIYQKQQPVDIPQVETRVLKDVLELPWGFEVYSLLTRWNPLDFHRPMPLPPSGYGPWEMVAFNLEEELVALGHDVTVFAAGGSKVSR